MSCVTIAQQVLGLHGFTGTRYGFRLGRTVRTKLAVGNSSRVKERDYVAVSLSKGRVMKKTDGTELTIKQQRGSAKHQPVCIDAASGTCTPTPAKIKLSELEDVRREMARVYREARGGMIDSSEAGRLAYILTGISKLIEATEIEKRLLQMERKLLK